MGTGIGGYGLLEQRVRGVVVSKKVMNSGTLSPPYILQVYVTRMYYKILH